MRNYIALAVPFFFLLIAVELWVARRRGVRTYRFNDALVDLSSGTAQQIAAVFLTAAMVATYVGIYEWGGRLGLPRLSASAPWVWLLCFLLVDFKYYWWHRLSHEVNFLWAAHVVHHSSEDYNLAVALRQSVTTLLTALPFALPLALLGFPPLVFITLESFSTLYQFWIHTELVGKLGWFERIFNSPSQHRVHHAVNPRYLDKNYGATLCIWDRLFGSFEEETEPCVFGLVHPLGSFDPLWAQLHYYVEVWQMAAAAPRARDKLLAWVKGPLWRPQGMPPCPAPPEVTREGRAKYEPPLGKGLRGYLWLQLVLALAATFFLMLFQNEWPLELKIAIAAMVLLAIFCWGALLEKKSWALPLEFARLLAKAVLLVYFLSPKLAAPSLALLVAAAILPQLALLWSARGATTPAFAKEV